jgi:hypothetical protein
MKISLEEEPLYREKKRLGLELKTGEYLQEHHYKITA